MNCTEIQDELTQEEVDAMLEEGLKLKHFQHQNVLSLIGVCVEASPAPYIITPFMSNGSLLKYLRKNKSTLVLSAEADEEAVSPQFLQQALLIVASLTFEYMC